MSPFSIFAFFPRRARCTRAGAAVLATLGVACVMGGVCVGVLCAVCVGEAAAAEAPSLAAHGATAFQDPVKPPVRDTIPPLPGQPAIRDTAVKPPRDSAVARPGKRGTARARGSDAGRHTAARGNTESMSEARHDSILNAMWPVKGPEPLPGSILPFKRIVAFYGNVLNTHMGVLGEYEPEEMLRRLDVECAAWAAADPSLPIQPALHFIAVVAQGSAGRDGKYRLRMDSAVIERVAGLARRRDALVFLDVQVGLSTLRDELPRLAPFLARPNFHLGIDPEFSMKDGTPPGRKVGTYDAADVNYASAFLADLVTKYNLPPKVLVVHRFTQRGLTNYREIKLDARVQIVVDMDGFGPPTLKKGTFHNYIKAEPVQFVGWKQFFKARNDSPRTTIAEILKLWPRPLYIQYQ